MPNEHPGTTRDGPDEGWYDARKGAGAYASIVTSVGGASVASIVFIFTHSSSDALGRTLIAMTTGLLVVAFLGSLHGAFGLAAIGAQQDPTANIAGAVIFIAAPVATAILSILGAFESLASFYVPQSATLFAFAVGLGGVFGAMFASFAISDSHGLHPRIMEPEAYDEWRRRQWLRTREQSVAQARRVALVSAAPIVLGFLWRFFTGLSVKPTTASINALVLTGLAICIAGAYLSLTRTVHPDRGNEQRSLRPWEAWTPPLLIGLYGLALMLLLPAGH